MGRPTPLRLAAHWRGTRPVSSRDSNKAPRSSCMHIVLRASAIALALVIAGCGRAPAVAAGAAEAGPLPQYFEMSVDGKRMVLSPDQPEVSLVTAAVKRDGTGLVMTASDKAHDVHFG